MITRTPRLLLAWPRRLISGMVWLPILLSSASALLLADAQNRAEEKHATSSPDFKMSRRDVQQDLSLFRRALEEGHGGLYRYSSRREMNAAFDAAGARLNHPTDVLEFFRILASVVGKIKCGHTELIMPAAIQKIEENQKLLPLKIAVLGRRIFVTRDYSRKSHLDGSEIISINAMPANEIFDRLSVVIHGDGNTSKSSAKRLSEDMTFAEQLFPLLGLHEPFQLVYRGADVQEKSLQLQGIERGDTETVRRTRYPDDAYQKDNAEFQAAEADSIGVLTIRSFRDYADVGRKARMRDFFASSFEQLLYHRSKVLILDLRDNGGGNDELGKLLATYLIDKPFSYYRDLIITSPDSDIFPKDSRIASDKFEKRNDGRYHRLNHPNLGIQQPSEPTFRGKVITLINGGSFSTTCELLSILRFHQRGIFIGEETGGSYYGNTSGYGATLILPNSKIKVDIPRLAYYMDVKGGAPDRGILPDIFIQYSIQELLSKRDKEMEAALAMAKNWLKADN